MMMTVPYRLQASILVVGCLVSTPGLAQSLQKPQVFIAATGGTIAGVQKSVEQHGYTAGELGVAALVEAVPQLKDIAGAEIMDRHHGPDLDRFTPLRRLL